MLPDIRRWVPCDCFDIAEFQQVQSSGFLYIAECQELRNIDFSYFAEIQEVTNSDFLYIAGNQELNTLRVLVDCGIPELELLYIAEDHRISADDFTSTLLIETQVQAYYHRFGITTHIIIIPLHTTR